MPEYYSAALDVMVPEFRLVDSDFCVKGFRMKETVYILTILYFCKQYCFEPRTFHNSTFRRRSVEYFDNNKACWCYKLTFNAGRFPFWLD